MAVMRVGKQDQKKQMKLKKQMRLQCIRSCRSIVT
jgi:hypothetical protein